MADWTDIPIGPWEKPPGPIDPPAPDQIQPTDPGWNLFVRKETDRTGLNWTPACSVSLEVSATGRTEERPLDGGDPDDYSADKDWGWKEDRTYETTPPEPYQDFTRWVRHYPRIRTQTCVEYRAQVFVRCGAHFVAREPSYFWVAKGQPNAGPRDEYDWTKTSGMQTGADGKPYKWLTTGKKTPPPWQRAYPLTNDFSHPQTTPPPWLVHPPVDPPGYGLDPKWRPDPKWDWKPKWDLEPKWDWKPKWDLEPKWDVDPKWDLGPRWRLDPRYFFDWQDDRNDRRRSFDLPFDPGSDMLKWFSLGEVFGKDGKAKKDR